MSNHTFDRLPDHSLGTGVYFSPQDYVGYWPRLIILAIDLFVPVVASGAIMMLGSFAVEGSEGLWFFVCLLGIWLYLVPLKRSRFGTLGYRVIGCRLVTLHGTRPSLLTLTARLAMWGFGPSTLAFDFVWCGIDQEGQTLRDRFIGVCVVKRRAQPIGEAPIHMAYYTVMGYTLFLPRVTRPTTEPMLEARPA